MPLQGFARKRRSLGLACATLAVAAACLACGDGAVGPAPGNSPVLQMLLVAHDTAQYVRITYGLPADDVADPGVRPVEPALVSLRVEDTSGGAAPLLALDGSPGRFVAWLEPRPGERFHLAGSLVDRPVAAEVTVPAAPVVIEPADDRLRLPSHGPRGVELPIRWTADGAAAFVVLHRRATGVRVEERIIRVSAGSTTFRLAPFVSGPDTTTLAFAAFEPNAAAFLLQPTPGGSLDGAFGMFGAASLAGRRITVVWE